MPTNSNATNYFSPARWVVSKVAGEGTHTTIASAIASASAGDTVTIMAGTYTENPVMVAGIDLEATTDCAYSGSVVINGTVNCSYSGVCSIAGIRLQTNSANAISLTGANATILNLIDCYLNVTNNTSVSSTGSNAAAQINFYQCFGSITGTGISFFSVSNGTVFTNGGIFSTASGNTTASTFSGTAILSATYSILNFPIVVSGTATCGLDFTYHDTSLNNVTSLTINGTGLTSFAINVRLGSGTAIPISIGASSTFYSNGLALSSTNAVAVTGTGSFTYTSLFQDNVVGTLSATTLIGKGTVGINSNIAPTAGYLGEVLSNSATGVAITSGGPKQVSSLVLSAGTWAIFGTAAVASTTATSSIAVSVNATTVTFTTICVDYNQMLGFNDLATPFGLSAPAQVITVASATTYYLNMIATFTGTATCSGKILAYRIA
jgi:hypothetical protein